MVDTKVSDFTSTASVDGTETLPVLQARANKVECATPSNAFKLYEAFKLYATVVLRDMPATQKELEELLALFETARGLKLVNPVITG